jgi:hypothetical protein
MVSNRRKDLAVHLLIDVRPVLRLALMARRDAEFGA